MKTINAWLLESDHTFWVFIFPTIKSKSWMRTKFLKFLHIWVFEL